MKANKTMVSNFMKTFVWLLFTILMSNSVLEAQSFSLFGVSDLMRVFGDGYKLPARHDTLKVFGIRGEIVSGQCVLFSKKNLDNVTVESISLKNQVNGKVLLAAHIDWNFVGSIPLSKNTPNQPLSALSRPAPASYPEYLMSDNQITLAKGMYQSVWLTINIPGNAEAGTFIGNVTVTSLQGKQSLPLCITIYPFTLPEERHLKVVEWYSTEEFDRFHGIREESNRNQRNSPELCH